MFEVSLQMAEVRLNSEIKSREKIENAKTPSDKEFWQKMYDERRENRLSRVKRRSVK